MQAFIRNFKAQGYEIKTGKYLAVRPQGKERFIRLKTLGENYTEESIKKQILAQGLPAFPARRDKPPIKRVKYKGNFKLQKITLKGLRALYWHYVYLLRKVQRQPVEKAPFSLREDIRKMDEISEQAKLLWKYKIETKEQLDERVNEQEARIVELVSERTSINNRLRKAGDEISRDELLKIRGVINMELSMLRKEVKRFDGILVRAEKIRTYKQSMSIDTSKSKRKQREHYSIRY